MSKEVKIDAISKLPKVLVYHTMTFLEPQELIRLILVSSFWQQGINQFVKHPAGQSWRSQQSEFQIQEAKRINENYDKTMDWAIKHLLDLGGYITKYGKFILGSVLIGGYLVKTNPSVMANMMTWVNPREILKNVQYGAGALVAGSLIFFNGKAVHQSIQHCKKNKQLNVNQKALKTFETLATPHAKL